jgi:cupin fold WbuC family metalloprotein
MRDIGGFHSVSREIVAGMALEAAKNERKRVHLLLHSGHDDQVQRLLIVMQPGTYVRPHHHSLQWEMLILLKGGGELLEAS